MNEPVPALTFGQLARTFEISHDARIRFCWVSLALVDWTQ